MTYERRTSSMFSIYWPIKIITAFQEWCFYVNFQGTDQGWCSTNYFKCACLHPQHTPQIHLHKPAGTHKAEILKNTWPEYRCCKIWHYELPQSLHALPLYKIIHWTHSCMHTHTQHTHKTAAASSLCVEYVDPLQAYHFAFNDKPPFITISSIINTTIIIIIVVILSLLWEADRICLAKHISC